MSAVLKIVDEHLGKGRDAPFELYLASERLTVRELIYRRVADEVDMIRRAAAQPRDNRHRTRSFLIRLDPSSAEARLNTGVSCPPGAPPPDLDAEMTAAEEAFRNHHFIMLLDDRQLTDLNEEIAVTAGNELVFLRLVPLVGG